MFTSTETRRLELLACFELIAYSVVCESRGGRPGPGSPSALNSRPYGLSVCTATQNELHFNVTLIVREQSQEPFPFIPPRPSYYTPGPFLQHVCTMCYAGSTICHTGVCKQPQNSNQSERAFLQSAHFAMAVPR